MKRLSILLLIPVFIFSCTKDKDTIDKSATIVGDWEQVARYSKDAAGQYSWTYISEPNYPPRIIFTTDGKYSMSFRDPIGAGNYQYDYAARQLQFQDPLSGTTSTSPVSYLDQEYLVIDMMLDGVLYAKNKYKRK
jgi:hypothetical protein